MPAIASTPFDIALVVNPTAQRNANFTTTNAIRFNYDGVAANADIGRIAFDNVGNVFNIDSTRIGGGTARPMVFRTGNAPTQAMRLLATGELIVGTATALSLGEKLLVRTDANAVTYGLVENQTDGTAARTAIFVCAGAQFGLAGATSGSLHAYSPSFTTAGLAIADSVAVVADATSLGGLVLRTDGNAPIIFGTNLNRRETILGNGEHIFGAATALTLGERVLVRVDQNAATYQLIENQTSGTAARSILAVSAGGAYGGAGTSGEFGVYSPAFTTAGLAIADAVYLAANSTASGGLVISTGTTAPLIFGTNSAEEMRLLSGGGLVINDTAMTLAGTFLQVTESTNGLIRAVLENPTTGTAASSAMHVHAGSDIGGVGVTSTLRSYSQGFTTAGLEIQASSSLQAGSNATGGLTIITYAAAPIIFGANNTRSGSFLSTGELVVGTATALDDVSLFMQIREDANANTFGAIINGTTGTAAQTQWTVQAGSAIGGVGINGSLIAFSQGFTTAGLNLQSSVSLNSGGNATGGLVVRTLAAAPIIFGTNNTRVGTALSGGAWIFGADTALSSTEFLKIQQDVNANHAVNIENGTTGTGALSTLRVVAGGALGGAIPVGSLFTFSQGYTTAGTNVQASVKLDSNGSATGGLYIGTSANAPYIFYTQDTIRGRFLGTGELIVGAATAIIGSEEALFQVDQNANSMYRFRNGTSGTAARGAIQIEANTSVGVMEAVSPAFTTSGIEVANSFIVYSVGATAGMGVGTADAASLTFWTNNARVGTFLSTGELIIGSATTLIASENVSVQMSANAVESVYIRNANAGASAFTILSVYEATNNGVELLAKPAANGATGPLPAGLACAVRGNSATLAVYTVGAQDLIFGTNNTRVGSFLSTGEFIVGSATSLIGSELLSVQRNANSALDFRMQNTTSGTAAQTRMVFDASAGNVVLGVTSAGFTTAGMVVQDGAYLQTNGASGGLHIGAADNAVVAFYQNNTKVYELDTTAGGLKMSRRFIGVQGADVASAGDLTLGNDGNAFEITGAVQINAITTTGWQNGSVITLLFTANPTVKHNTAGGASTAVMLLAGASDFGATAGDVLTLILSEIGGTQAWREMSRTVI